MAHKADAIGNVIERIGWIVPRRLDFAEPQIKCFLERLIVFGSHKPFQGLDRVL